MFKAEKTKNVGIFYVSGKDNFERLITIFNGNLSTKSKQKEFENWLLTFNQQYKMDINYKNNLIIPSLSNSWISGFFDALGCFNGRIKNCKKNKFNKVPYLSFSIKYNEFYIIKLLRDVFLNTQKKNLNNIKYDKSIESWVFHCSDFIKLKVIRRYLSIHKLRTTSKSLAFRNWCKIHNLVLNKEHLTEDGLNKINLLTKKLIS
uniref:Homing endonuclease LAGLIDADG domain-containing protein n=1 Tax=Arthrobotrys musiformis TaxID=47236 RepID=A0A482EBW7_9PEZI|nr:hypothetical protein [Arthrobotrys musiformis]QBM31515.1 hypothetical protein [Arthrobotrys musiformis]QBM31665.1 hypothetical protein [Arthrobotrys musiformis]